MATSSKRKIGMVDHPSNRKITGAACIELVLGQIPGVMDQMLDALSRMAGLEPKKPVQGLASAFIRPELRPIIQQMLGQRESLRSAFAGQVRVLAYGGIIDKSGPRPLVRFDEIEMLDVRQLDENIELARVQQELDYAVGEQLPRLSALMCSVMGWVSVQPSINPLRTEIFARALRDTLAAHLSAPEMRTEVLAAAAGRLGLGLRQIYRELIGWLMSHGVEPAGLTAPNLASVLATDSHKSNEATRVIVTMERLRRLFAEMGGMDAMAGGGGGDFLHTVPASVQALQDMKQVDAMIHRLEVRKKEQMAVSGNAAAQQVDMLQRPAPVNGKTLGEQIGEEVTRMMLDNLTQDDRLLPKLRHALRGLTPALLPLSKVDARFFSDQKHPARQFLDRVTDRSLAYTNESDAGYLRLLNSVEVSVQAIVAWKGTMAGAFEDQMRALQTAWLVEDKSQNQVREEAARALLHVEQRNLLAQRLVDDWVPKLADQPLPPLVRGFLLGPWVQVVAESQLNCATGRTDPQGFMAVVDDLVWSVNPKQARRNPVKLVKLIPSMLGTLRAGLQMVSFPQQRIGQFFDELIACHEAVLQEARGSREVLLPPVADAPKVALTPEQARQALDQLVPSQPEADSQWAPAEAMPSQAPWLAEDETHGAGYLEADSVIPPEETQAIEISDVDRQEAYAASDTIAEGAWVELRLEGQWTRLKLTWSSPHRTLFMFTSNKGRAHSMSRRSMSKLMASGMIRIVSDGLMIDQALDNVAQQALMNSISDRA